ARSSLRRQVRGGAVRPDRSGQGAGEWRLRFAGPFPAGTPAASPRPGTDDDVVSFRRRLSSLRHAMKLRIEFNNPSHRFISKMTITVTADGTTLTKLPASKPGALLFDVPDTATDISIKAEIPHPTGGTPKILDTTQNYKKKSTSGGSPILTPQSPINQRFTVTGWLGVTKKSAGVFLLKLDLTFLDLTAYAAGLPSSNQFTYSPSHGCAFAVLECTDDYFDRKGDEAITWAVLIPPAIVNTPSPTAINALLFLRPTIPLKNPTLRIHAYTNTDDVRNVTFRFT